MNDQLQEFSRSTLKSGLEKCNDGQKLMFKRMYSHLDLDKDINDVVDCMEEEKLNLAMLQVQRTVDTNASDKHK